MLRFNILVHFLFKVCAIDDPSAAGIVGETINSDVVDVIERIEINEADSIRRAVTIYLDEYAVARSWDGEKPVPRELRKWRSPVYQPH